MAAYITVYQAVVMDTIPPAAASSFFPKTLYFFELEDEIEVSLHDKSAP